MVDIATVMQEYLAGKVSYPVYVNRRPTDVDKCVTLMLDGGSDTTYYLQYNKEFTYPMVMLYVRTLSYVEGHTVCSELVDLLRSFKREDLGIRGVRMLGNLSSLGVDDKNRQEFMLVYSIIAEEEF